MFDEFLNRITCWKAEKNESVITSIANLATWLYVTVPSKRNEWITEEYDKQKDRQKKYEEML